MTKQLKWIPVLLIVVFLFPTCKKGEDDPFISFRSRKARVTGNWKMKKGTVTRKFTWGPEYTTTYTEDSYEMTVIETNGIVSTYTGDAKFTFEFKDDGKANMQKKLANESLTGITDGTWGFAGGAGKIKNKEQIVITSPYLSGLLNAIVYNIKELRNTKLVLFREMNVNDLSYKEEFTFEQ